MIGKHTSGSNAKGILEYCYYQKKKSLKKVLTIDDVRGEVIYIQNLSATFLEDGRLDISNLTSQFEEMAATNTSVKNYIWHQTFSFKKGEKLSDDNIEYIISRFTKEFDLCENELIAFKHEDTDHNHFHIVANRINYGKTTSDSYSFLKTGSFCRKIEQELGLSVTPNMFKLDKSRKHGEVINTNISRLRSQVDEALKYTSSMIEMKNYLSRRNIKMNIGRGVTFISKKSGVKVKGSYLGRSYSFHQLETFFAQKLYEKEIIEENEPKEDLIEKIEQPNTITPKNLSTQLSIKSKPLRFRR